MSKVAFALPLAALALLGACATEDKATPAPVVIAPAPVVTAPPAVVVQQPSAVVPASIALRPGHGRIESIAAVPPSAAAGGGTATRRIGVKMDDETLQFVDTNAAGLQIGDRIEITPEGTLRR